MRANRVWFFGAVVGVMLASGAGAASAQVCPDTYAACALLGFNNVDTPTPIFPPFVFFYVGSAIRDCISATTTDTVYAACGGRLHLRWQRRR
jgi:hypothetical protein